MIRSIALRLSGLSSGKFPRIASRLGCAFAASTASAFQRETQRLIRVLKTLPRAAGVDEILMPGERGRRTLERRTREGIPLPPVVVAELSKVAAALGVTMFGA